MPLSDELGESGIRVWHLAVVGVLAAVMLAVFAYLGSHTYDTKTPAHTVEPQCRSDEQCPGGICLAGKCAAVRSEEEI